MNIRNQKFEVLNRISQLTRELDELKQMKKDFLKEKMGLCDKMLIKMTYHKEKANLKSQKRDAIRMLEKLNKES